MFMLVDTIVNAVDRFYIVTRLFFDRMDPVDSLLSLLLSPLLSLTLVLLGGFSSFVPL